MSARPDGVGIHLLSAGVVADDVICPVVVQDPVVGEYLLWDSVPGFLLTFIKADTCQRRHLVNNFHWRLCLLSTQIELISRNASWSYSSEDK